MTYLAELFLLLLVDMSNSKFILLIALLVGITSFVLLSPTAPKAKQLRHVVAFRFKPQVTLQQMQQVTRNFQALPQKIPQILAFEGGPDVSFQQKSGKFTHCFMCTSSKTNKSWPYMGSTRIIKPSVDWSTRC